MAASLGASAYELYMGEETQNTFKSGVFLIDKPAGISSFGVVSRMRRVLGIKKVGHAGTLDPFATGLLIVCGGRAATKLISRFMEGQKEYLTTLLLGVETKTQDPEGEVTSTRTVGTLTPASIEEVLEQYRGEQLQTPPAYSALKHKGKPLYYYARKGIEVKKEPRKILIRELERIGNTGDLSGETAELQLRIVCSKGTYIRTLGAEIGNSLGCGAHLVQLRRTRSGQFDVQDALSWDELQSENALQHCMEKMLSVERVANLLQ